MPTLRLLACGTAAAAILALAAGFGTARAVVPTAAHVVAKIENFTFEPHDLTVAPGTTVTWTNGDDIPHSVVPTDGSFRSPALDTDDAFSHLFTTPGVYTYFCSIHPHMTGKVVVRPPAD